ncbi:superoxide dismutase, Fe-Mn family [Trypanosoma rangeli]|uniref:Superoxide dismutase, Fe-Mn family n=1 Tax=Trypanosoma rangeli TaxID=5698 RepID=A0A3R7K8T3_TRYRA|nr:superoxide dismutase, Fe-Mn family [Trypanosoma rangeli]RNF01832.1 superoxide dismutase, Fe-Mn family [Trypanosoma rangeli]|eukprot:RNF01832.1 superoxide dismutase, Fe-Mn family [Trypanosoma rangeli]
MSRITSALLCAASASRAALVASELQKLVPVLIPLLDPPVVRGEVSAAHLIAITGHTSRRNDVHQPDCPVLRQLLPLTALADHSAFLKRPCRSCLKRRIHFLSSEHFCMNLEEKCSQGGVNVPAEWESIVATQFGSVVCLMEEFVMYAKNRREPGWTWLVYDKERSESHRLVVVNFPSNRVPLELGLWPLAVINMTESRLLSAIVAKATTTVVESPPAPWSRAARNTFVAATVTSTVAGTTATTANTVGDLGKDLSSIRAQIAQEAVLAMNWEFVLQQWRQAESYYTSVERENKICVHRTKMEREAALAAMSKLRDSGATILTSDTVEITVAGGNTAAKKASQDQTVSTQTTQENGKEQKEETEGAVGAADQDPHCVQLEDGTWQYTYQNGAVTLLRPDGTRVFKKSELNITIFADGSTLYEYPNNTSILDRVDGVRVTTFADGTKKEELYK